MDEMVRFASWTTLEIGCAMPKGSSVAKFELCADAVVLSWLVVDGFVAVEV